jgi:hypothetical protein
MKKVLDVLICCSSTKGGFLDAIKPENKNLIKTLQMNFFPIKKRYRMCFLTGTEGDNYPEDIKKICKRDKFDIIWFAGCNFLTWIFGKNSINLKSIRRHLKTRGIFCFSESTGLIKYHKNLNNYRKSSDLGLLVSFKEMLNHPVLANQGIDKKEWETNFNKYYSSTPIPYIYTIKNPRMSFGKEKCYLYVRLNPKAIKKLKDLIKSPKNTKELSGSFIESEKRSPNGQKILELSVNNNSIIGGVADEVDAVWSRYNFHTHPKQAYKLYNVTRGWPSGKDFAGFIQLDHHTILHIVATLEGIYTISFNPNFNYTGNIDDIYVSKKYDISHKRKLTFKKYCRLINRTNYKNKGPLFYVKYMPWDNASQILKIAFKPTKQICASTEKSFQKIN